MSTSCFSAPGKALLAGGYLVLDQKYKAYVVALSTRMHSVVRGNAVDNGFSTISIDSPQFKDAAWEYRYEDTVTDRSKEANPFLLSTIEVILAYVLDSKRSHNVKVTIFSDPAYHSQNNVSVKTCNGKQFLYHDEPIKEVPKTGLGSSAGLVTVVTAALLSYFKPELDLFSENGLQTVHNLAQISHCAAQGKVGSGFDVAAATYGSIIYQRFDPALVTGIIKLKETAEHQEYQTKLQKLVDSKWDMVIQKCDLPPHIRILMGDVNNGSETPKLVSKVQKWRQENPTEAEQIYLSLDFYNMKLVSELLNMTKISIEDPEGYKEIISLLDDYSLIQLKHKIKMSDPSFVDKIDPVLAVIESISAIRKNLQTLTMKTGADIEPTEQTILLDNCFTLPGVLGGVVPGAGGYDAICLLCSERAAQKIVDVTKATETNISKIKDLLSKASLHNQREFANVDLDTIDVKLFENITWLDLHEENKGLVKEDIKNYNDLL